MNLQDEIRNYVVETFLFGDQGDLDNDESLMNGGVIDSTGVLELVMFIETNYGLSIENEEMIPQNLDSVNRLARFVGRKVGPGTVSEPVSVEEGRLLS